MSLFRRLIKLKFIAKIRRNSSRVGLLMETGPKNLYIIITIINTNSRERIYRKNKEIILIKIVRINKIEV